MRSLMLSRFVLTMLGVVGLAGCKDSLYCKSNSDCSGSTPFCDVNGTIGGIGHTCIPDPVNPPPDAMQGCDEMSDCSGVTPACRVSTGQCVECIDNTTCGTAELPVCDTTMNECEGCSGDTDCAGRADGRLACDSSTMICQECTDNADCTTSAEPICDTGTKMCRGCTADSECASGVCNTVEESTGIGSCVAAENVIYVAQGGMGTQCTQVSKCDTLAEGVAKLGDPTAARKWILIEASGTQFAAGTVTIDDKTAIIKGTGATVRSNVDDAAALIVSGTSNVTIEGLTLTAPQENATPDNADAIRCTDAGSDVPTLVLRNVRLQNSEGQGLHAVTACNITITGSTISGNAGGGVFLSNSNFSIVNNFILGNGSVAATTRGVRIATISGSASPTLFAFNTMVDNLSNGAPRSFSCSDVDKVVTLSGNLIWGILDEEDVTPAATEPECVHRYSLLAPHVYSDGTNNVDITGVTKASVFSSIVDPIDFHLKGGSAAINAADPTLPTGTPTTDFDNQQRVQGGRADIGADERE